MHKTPFYESHLNSGGKIVDFGGYALPVNYGSQIKEHEIVREDAGMFDVSHMVITDITGDGSKNFLRRLLTNDISKLEKHGIGKAFYSAMLNPDGCVIDDLICYLMPDGYRLVTNAATKEKDLNWLNHVAKEFKVQLNTRIDLAMIAVQGPQAIDKVATIFPQIATELTKLKPFVAITHDDYFLASTGYTGEKGLEIILPAVKAAQFWQQLLDSGVQPCGLGARDTLRLEAGMNLYGHDMDEKTSPISCGMDWVVDLSDESRNFIGREAYTKLKQSNYYPIQVGLILKGRGVLREGQAVYLGDQCIGKITSGTFSPTMKQSIAIAMLDKPVENVSVDIRGNLEDAKVVKLPFVRNGKMLACA